MSLFSEIERRRAAHGIRQSALCKRARVHPTTYSALKSARRGGNVRTLARLDTALDALIAEKAQAKVNCEPEGGLSQSQLQEGGTDALAAG